ncbi:MAG: hypothetical protein IJR14_02515 [Synergistaceae bacterium]|nr:hypothetical protein [Synergistaceae bacterium]
MSRAACREVLIASAIVCQLLLSVAHGADRGAFAESLVRMAEALTKDRPHTDQDVSFVKDRTGGDEAVYTRAWRGAQHVVLRGYENSTWRRGRVARFWTDDPSLGFPSGLRPGSPVEDLLSAFGGAGTMDGAGTFTVPSGMERLKFETRGGRVRSIGYDGGMAVSERLAQLLPAYMVEPPRQGLSRLQEADLLLGGRGARARREGGDAPGIEDVLRRHASALEDEANARQSRLMGALAASEAVPVRSGPGTGRVLFHLSASEGGYVLVDRSPTRDAGGQEWFRIEHRYVAQGGRAVLRPMGTEAWVLGRSIRPTPLSSEDRMMLRDL